MLSISSHSIPFHFIPLHSKTEAAPRLKDDYLPFEKILMWISLFLQIKTSLEEENDTRLDAGSGQTLRLDFTYLITRAKGIGISIS